MLKIVMLIKKLKKTTKHVAYIIAS